MAGTTSTATLIGAGDAARRIGVSAEYLRYLARADRIRCQQTPYGRLYEVEDVERFRQEREAASQREAA